MSFIVNNGNGSTIDSWTVDFSLGSYGINGGGKVIKRTSDNYNENVLYKVVDQSGPSVGV